MARLMDGNIDVEATKMATLMEGDIDGEFDGGQG